MEGITILEEHIIYRANLVSVWLVVGGTISILSSLFYLLTDLFNEDKYEILPTLLVAGLSSFLIGILTIGIIPGSPSDQARYIIRVEEKININELLDNYEIISHEKYSNIYEIKGDIINDNT